MTPASGARRLTTVQLIICIALAFAVLRFGFAVISGLQFDRGDFYATMPPAYAERLNPTLWNSPDLSDSWVFQRRVYLYGPTQYLSIAPLVYVFDSYREVSRFLLVAYGLLIVASTLVMRKAFGLIRPLPWQVTAAVAASTLAFLPLLQAYAQREFEVVVYFASVCAVYFLLRRREVLAGALMAYVTWFKFLPLLWAAYLALRRWGRGLAAFALVSAVIWGAAAAFLGIGNFSSLWELAGQELMKGTSSGVMCSDFVTEDQLRFAYYNTTSAGVKYALCRFGSWWPWLPVPLMYWGLLGVMLGSFLYGFWRLERAVGLDHATEGWRRALEASVVLIVSTGYFYAHYYYLSLLVIVLNALLVRYLTRDHVGWLRPAAWVVCYATLTAFVLPPTVLSRIFGVDIWHLYMRHALYVIGEALLIALVWWEYLAIPVSAPQAAA